MIWSVLFFIFGLFLGGLLINNQWISNSKYPQLILHRNKFYKTVEINNEESWDLLEIHRKDY
jgi:hypothetical protein